MDHLYADHQGSLNYVLSAMLCYSLWSLNGIYVLGKLLEQSPHTICSVLLL